MAWLCGDRSGENFILILTYDASSYRGCNYNGIDMLHVCMKGCVVIRTYEARLIGIEISEMLT